MHSYSVEELTVLCEIRKCLVNKAKYAPVYVSADEFSQWQDRHRNYYLHSGYLSIWDGIEVPSGYDEVVIQKKRTRDGAKPYLVFRDVEAFHEYCRNVRLLGVESYVLLEKKFSKRMMAFAEEYRVPESAYDRLQSELERFMGLNFMADVSAQSVSDRQIYGSLYNYFKRALLGKVASVFGNYGIEIDIDTAELNMSLSSEDSPETICILRVEFEEDKVDSKLLLFKIIDLMDKLENKKDSRFDMKDNLLSQVVRSDRATKEFLSNYYAALKDRRSVWRPVAFSYQVHFAHDNGVKYLKNPTFIQTCGDTSIGEMIENQINTYKSADINEKALGNMYSFLNRLRDENIQNITLVECAGNSGQSGKASEQIGKALSKELRTEEARGSLARALLVSVLERSEATYHFADAKGEDYHE